MLDLKSLTYRQKNICLASVSLLFLVVIYLMAFSKTIELYRSNTEIEKKLMRAEEAPEQIRILQNKLKILDQRFTAYINDSLNSQDKILEMVSRFCHGNKLTLNELPVTSIYEEEDFMVETNEIIAEGDFVNLLKLLYELEYRSRIARIRSAIFNSYFDNKRKKNVLTLTIYLQNLKVKKKEL